MCVEHDDWALTYVVERLVLNILGVCVFVYVFVYMYVCVFKYMCLRVCMLLCE